MAKLRLLLILAFLLSGITTFLCAFGSIAAPVQSVETKAELRQSQRTGLPISDEEIDRHVSRGRSQSWVFGLIAILAGAATGMILAAIMSLPIKTTEK